MLLSSLIKKDLKNKKTLSVIFIFITFIFCMLLSISFHLYNESNIFFNEAYEKTNQPKIMVAFLNTTYKKQYSNLIIKKCKATRSYIQTYFTGTFLENNKSKEIAFFSPYTNKDFKKAHIPILKKNEIFLSQSLKNRYNLHKNKKIKLKVGSKKEKFVIKGFFDDPVFSSALSGQTRILVSRKEFQTFSKFYPYNSMGKYKILSAYPSLRSRFNLNSVMEHFPDTTVDYSYNNIESNIKLIPSIFIILLLTFSVFLFITIFIMIWYSIISTVDDNRNDFAILLSQGFTKHIVILNYMFKPITMVFLGCCLGIAGEKVSYLFISKYLSLLTGINWEIEGTYSVTIIIIICLLIGLLLCTLYFYKFLITFNVKPTDIIFKIKAQSDKHSKINIRIKNIYPKMMDFVMGLNSFLSKFKQTSVLFLIVTIFTFLMSIAIGLLGLFSNNTNALKVLGANDGDVILLGKGNLNNVDNRLNDLMKKIRLDKDVSYYSLMDDKNLKISNQNVPTTIISRFNKSTRLLEGVYPKKVNEILLSNNLTKKIDKTIGDKVTIKFDKKETNAKVVGVYQSIDNDGISAKLSENSFKLLDNSFVPKKAAINLKTYNEKKINKLISKYDNSSNINVQNGRASYITGVEYVRLILTSLIIFILCVLIIFSILLVSMLVKITLVKEKNRFLILKSIGFSNKHIRNMLIYRFLSAIVIGQLIGTLLAVLFKTKIIFLILSYIGLSSVTVQLPIKSLLFIDLVVLLVNAIFILLTSRFSRKG